MKISQTFEEPRPLKIEKTWILEKTWKIEKTSDPQQQEEEEQEEKPVVEHAAKAAAKNYCFQNLPSLQFRPKMPLQGVQNSPRNLSKRKRDVEMPLGATK